MCSEGNEILTLAFGHYSSHVATHFFNIQEASFSFNPNFSSGINHKTLFREGEGHSSSLSPRFILIDDEESLGYLSKEGYFRETNEPLLNESFNSSVIVKEPSWERNEFLSEFLSEKQRLIADAGPCKDVILKSSYKLDDCVASWSDYLIPEFNNKTIVTLPKHSGHYENYESFTLYQSGIGLWETTNLSENVEEKIRYFLEESDNLQGFQLIADGDNGYSGISSCCVEYLKDEYPKKALITLPVIFLNLSLNEDVRIQHKKRCEKLYSLASSFSLYSEFCNLITPLSHILNPWSKEPHARTFRNMKYKEELMYQTSSILASAFDLFSLPYRLQSLATNMNDLCASLNIYGRSFAAVGLNLPFPMKKNDQNWPIWEEIGGRFFESLTPMINVNPEFIDVQSIASKGLGRSYLNISDLDTEMLKSMKDNFRAYLHSMFPRVVTQLSTCKSSFRIPRTFPNILDSFYNLANSVHDFGPLSEYISVGGLHNTREMFHTLNNLYEETKTLKKRPITGFRPKDSDVEYDQLFENLKTTTESYRGNTFL